jgi:hypothetical protein
MPERFHGLRDEMLFWASLALFSLLIPNNWQALVSHPVALAVCSALLGSAATILIWQRYTKKS